MAFFVDSDLQVLSIETLAIGCADAVEVKAGPIFCRARAQGAAGIVLAHNHPSGDARPSEEDIKLTRRMALVSECFDAALVDHVIIAGDKCFSFRRSGLI